MGSIVPVSVSCLIGHDLFSNMMQSNPSGGG